MKTHKNHLRLLILLLLVLLACVGYMWVSILKTKKYLPTPCASARPS